MSWPYWLSATFERLFRLWFQGMNPQLDELPPARLLSEGHINEAAQSALAAASAFAAAG
jgi:hypothetical protein